MRKQLLALLLCLAALAGVSGPALAAGEAASAEPSVPQIYVDGALYEHAYTAVIEHVTYVSLPALAQVIRPTVTASWENGRAVLRDEGLELTAKPGDLYLCVNGRYLYIAGGVQVGYDENGGAVCTLVPARTLAQALGAALTWDGAIQISTAGAVLPVSGAEFYDADAVFLLSHIIYNESGNQPMEGRIAVGNVLLNRVAHPSFPGTLYDVVYQPGQFYPEKTGCMEKTPNAESVAAAKLCLEGAVVVPNAYWFNGVGNSCWASRNKTSVAVIGGHAFYG